MENEKMETVSPPVSPPRGMWGIVLMDVVLEIPKEIPNPPPTPPPGPPPMSPQTQSTLPPPSAPPSPPSRKAFLTQNKKELFQLLNSKSDLYTIFKPSGSIFIKPCFVKNFK
jgi:hypothetical protein